MADESNAQEPGSAAQRPEVGDKDQAKTTDTRSGREASPHSPDAHDREHQSNYGGGGENGGASSDKR